MAWMSVTIPPGFAIDSMNTALVRDEISRRIDPGSVASAQRTCQPNLRKASPNWLIEPP